MTFFLRWLKFNLVGAMGFVLQLGSLALFHHFLGKHYLLASAAATELALLHNFFWHMRYTWRDRCDSRPAGKRFIRFQMTNGLVSMAGNLLFVRIFARAHLSIIFSNILAIFICSLINFFVGHVWAFRAANAQPHTSALQA